MTSVWLDAGSRWVFASALDWPGWARRGRGEESALEALDSYAARYAAIAARAGVPFEPGPPEVAGRSGGVDAVVDFGAPGGPGAFDTGPPPAVHVALLRAAWAAFDDAVAGAPASLRKGPRGGGRDRDDIGEHVREAERAYARKLGVRVAPRTPWAEQRAAIVEALVGPPEGDAGWPPRYFLRRAAWHVSDHAWEIEDRGA